MTETTLIQYERLLQDDSYMVRYQAEYINRLVGVVFSRKHGTDDTHNVKRKAV